MMAAVPHTIHVRVRFAETDQMGIAHHGSYVPWLEMGRVEWLRGRGLSYRTMEEEGVSLAVSKLEIDYRAAVRFDDELTVETRLLEGRSRRFVFGYRVELGDALVATASSVHTPIDPRRRAVRMPERWMAALTGVEPPG
jgi:acyl-CoA thioester hydrolase